MSATYNWAYKPGVTNKYGITIPASADDVKPSNACYVALFGNDVTGNGSRQNPFRTLTKAKTFSGIIIIGSGKYFESGASGMTLIGDGDVIIDGSFVGDVSAIGGAGSLYVVTYNITFQNWTEISGFEYKAKDCTFKNILNIYPYNGTAGFSYFDTCVFYNCTNLNIKASTTPNQIKNVTIDKCTNVIIRNASVGQFSYTSLIITNSNIWFSEAYTPLDYSLFYNCNFRFIAASPATPAVFYPSVPVGYTAINTIEELMALHLSSYPAAPINFNHSKVTDPNFNNPAITDYTLAFGSPAKNLSFNGTFVGAKSIAYPLKAKATESLGGFEFSSAVNLTIADDSITLTNPALDAQIDTNVIVNTLSRQIANFSSYGFNADRNGQYIDSIADLDTVTKAAGDALIIPAPYIVEGGAILYNGNQYQPGDRFTTVVGQTVFTTVASGVVREILEAPQRHTIMARFSDGGAAVAAGDALVAGNYYYVQTGSVTYNSVVYNAGVTFKAINTNAFSGSGTVTIALSTESFQHYEPGVTPTSNNVGDAHTGAIIRGNGDPAYLRGGLGVKEFPINAKFIQVRYYIRTNNLKP